MNKVSRKHVCLEGSLIERMVKIGGLGVDGGALGFLGSPKVQGYLRVLNHRAPNHQFILTFQMGPILGGSKLMQMYGNFEVFLLFCALLGSVI